MEQHKPYDELTLEELLELALSEETHDGYERLTDIETFILETKIRPSEKVRVEGPLIYWAYCKWCKTKRIVPLKRHPFFAEFKKRFTVVLNDHGGPKYLVEPEPFEISKDEWWVMRKAMRNEKEKAAKRSKKPRTKS